MTTSGKLQVNLAFQRRQGKPMFFLAILAILFFPLLAEAKAKPTNQPASQSGNRPVTNKPSSEKGKDEKPSASKPTASLEPVIENAALVGPMELVDKPQDFLNKNIKFTAKFFAFSSLALDYKPAFRSSKTHLSFMILRPNSHIPLSELKLAMMIPKEKDPDNALLAALKDGDQLEIIGKEFSTALDEPWVEVFKIKKLAGAEDEKKTVVSDGNTSKDDQAKSENDSKESQDGKTEKSKEEKPSAVPTPSGK